MTREKLLGVCRELLAAIAGALVAWGVNVGAWWPEVAGLVLAAVSLAWGLHANEGPELIWTGVRKVISAAAGAAVATGIATPEKAAAAAGLAGALLSLTWAVNKRPPAGVLRVLILAAALCLVLPGCADLAVSGALRHEESGVEVGGSYERAADGSPGGRWSVSAPVERDGVRGRITVDGGSGK